MNKQITCFGCGALVPAMDGPTHKYMLSSPGCWKLYGDILAKEYTMSNWDPDTHRITVDTYAVTHPGIKERRAIQSVNVHLISLYCTFEKNISGVQATRIIKKVVEDKNITSRFTWLEPPQLQGTMNVTDVVQANDFEDHKKLVRAWGRSAWQAWKQKHLHTIEAIVAELGM
ncbi:MAG TPA: DUF5946 family protein [Candidatus Saccharimonadales bacterium]|nr:DUF5946 family protein [Candidatus Saccharimonadales bacterium]